MQREAWRMEDGWAVTEESRSSRRPNNGIYLLAHAATRWENMLCRLVGPLRLIETRQVGMPRTPRVAKRRLLRLRASIHCGTHRLLSFTTCYVLGRTAEDDYEQTDTGTCIPIYTNLPAIKPFPIFILYLLNRCTACGLWRTVAFGDVLRSETIKSATWPY